MRRWTWILVLGSALSVATCTTRKLQEEYENRRTPVAEEAPTEMPSKPKSANNTASVDDILQRSCGGNACHGPEKGSPVYVGKADAVNSDRQKLITRVENGSMPVPGSGKTLSDSDRKRLLDYLRGLGSSSTPQDPRLDNKGQAGTSVDTTSTRPYNCPSEASLGTPSKPLSFANDINPILQASCGGGGCHSPGSEPRAILVNNETMFYGTAVAILTKFDLGTMPTGGKTISAEAKKTVIQALCTPKK